MVLGGSFMISRRVILLVFLSVGTIILLSSTWVVQSPPFPEKQPVLKEVPYPVQGTSGQDQALIANMELKSAEKDPSWLSDSIPQEKPVPPGGESIPVKATPTPSLPPLPPPTQPPLPPTPTLDPSSLYPPLGKPLPAINPSTHPPPTSRVPLTPLLIGFTRNYPILQQCVLSYLAAGWPANQIYIIDNTGTMDSNRLALLSPENPFYLPYAHLENVLGVKVVSTPTLLSFAQLQNYFINFATEHGWERFFWSHMDSVVLSYEDRIPFVSLYNGVLEALSKLDYPDSENPDQWALKFFSYDRLTLVHTNRVKSVGAWDTFIPYYYTDCDFYHRIYLSPYTLERIDLAYIYDVADLLPDLSLFFPGHESYPEISGSPEQNVNKTRWGILRSQLTQLDAIKNQTPGGRNYWQAKQRGGEGEPFYRGMGWFESELQRLFAWGESVYVRKWGLIPAPGGEGGGGRCSEELIQEGKGWADIWRGMD